MIFFSRSEMTRDLRSGPARTRSIASSSSSMVISFLLRRAASRAASFTTLARSAPVNPGVRRVEDVGPVGRGHEDDAGPDVEPVHLDEELVQRLLSLVVAPPEPGAAVA